MKYLYQDIVQTSYGCYCLELTDEMVDRINRKIAEDHTLWSEVPPHFTADDLIEIWADGPCELELPCSRKYIQWAIEGVMVECTEPFIHEVETEETSRTADEADAPFYAD